MIPGTFIYRLWPKLTTGTHCGVNYRAFTLLKKHQPALDLPHWQDINGFEGQRGIDGLWLRNKHLTSLSTYNPETDQGHGLEEMWRQFDQLSNDWQPQQLAYLSHIITDICTPSHQHGKPIAVRQRRWYGVMRVRDDWDDNQWQHTWFEISTVVRLMMRPLAPARLQQRFIQEYKKTTDRASLVHDYMKRKSQRLRTLQVFSEYTRNGWTERVDNTMRKLVLPQMISLVATFWYLAAPGNSVRNGGSRHY